jgi:hypothetical protein
MTMKLMLTVALFLSASGSAFAADKPVMRICQFSLNNSDEFAANKDFIDKLNANSQVSIEVKEFMPNGSKPEEAFRKMVQSGVRCDGLIISGHHTGAYGGHRANGKLSMDFMESLSCDPKNAEFFENLHAAWLQGCRTLGVGEIEANDEQADADFHTNRVGQVVDADGLDQNFAELNMEFSNTLDQDNPLASRYLRLFPNAKLFGWTRSAPGEKSKSYMSLLYHMAQMAKRLDAEDQFPKEGPAAKNMSPESAAKFANAMLLTLTHFSAEEKGCESLAVDSWLAHGNVGKPTKYYFDNPDLKAYSSLSSTGDSTLLEAKSLDCMLKKAAREKDASAMENLLDGISQRPEFLRYSFNTLVDLRASLANAKDEASKKVAAVILDRMKSNKKVLEFTKGKLSSRQVGFTRKIDYYKFYNLLTGEKLPEVEAEITSRGIDELSRPLPALDPNAAHPARSRNLAASYRATVIQAIVKNKLAGPTFYEDLLAKKPEADVLKSMALQVFNYTPSNRVKRLVDISRSPNADANVAAAVIKQLQNSGIDQNTFNSLYYEIMENAGRRSADDGSRPASQPQPQRPRNFLEELFGG